MTAITVVTVIACVVALAAAQPGLQGGGVTIRFTLGQQGKSCIEACTLANGSCAPGFPYPSGENIKQRFGEANVNCAFDEGLWNGSDEPNVVVDLSHPNFGKCMGWKGASAGGQDCAASNRSVRRLCFCKFS